MPSRELKITDTENTRQEQAEEHLTDEEFEAQRAVRRENARRVLRESGLANMLRAIDKDELKGRGKFEEYDSLVLLKWGTGYTGRHIWAEIKDDSIRFRLNPHRLCSVPAPLCDGEYHTFTASMWNDRDLLWSELKKYYAKKVAESSSD